MSAVNFDDLELELRKLPGVRAAGFTERDDMLVVQVQVSGDDPSPGLSQQAARIAYRHADKPVALEVVRWRTVASAPAAIGEVQAAAVVPATVGDDIVGTTDDGDAATGTADEATRGPRVRLLAVLTFPDTDELEVHLTFGGRRVIGRSSASAGVAGAVHATIDGLKTFIPDLNVDVLWAEELAGHDASHAAVVACAIQVSPNPVLGIAAGGSKIEAAARATLHALNRKIQGRAISPA